MEKFIKLVHDMDELKWFFNHCVKEPSHKDSGYMITLNKRSKIARHLNLGKDSMLNAVVIKPVKDQFDFHVFLKKVRSLECNIEAYDDDKGRTLPIEVIRPYLFLQEHDESIIINDSMRYMNSIKDFNDSVKSFEGERLHVYDMDQFIESDSNRMMKSSRVIGLDSIKLTSWEDSSEFDPNDLSLTDSQIQRNQDLIHGYSMEYRRSDRMRNSKSYLWDFDIDLDSSDVEICKLYERIHKVLGNYFNYGEFVIIRTSGGFHVLTKQKTGELCKHLIQSLKSELSGLTKEIVKNGQVFIPLPGSINYKNINNVFVPELIKVLNKNDFNETQTLY